jgi:hypothetical protein
MDGEGDGDEDGDKDEVGRRVKSKLRSHTATTPQTPCPSNSPFPHELQREGRERGWVIGCVPGTLV